MKTGESTHFNTTQSSTALSVHGPSSCSLLFPIDECPELQPHYFATQNAHTVYWHYRPYLHETTNTLPPYVFVDLADMYCISAYRRTLDTQAIWPTGV